MFLIFKLHSCVKNIALVIAQKNNYIEDGQEVSRFCIHIFHNLKKKKKISEQSLSILSLDIYFLSKNSYICINSEIKAFLYMTHTKYLRYCEVLLVLEQDSVNILFSFFITFNNLKQKKKLLESDGLVSIPYLPASSVILGKSFKFSKFEFPFVCGGKNEAYLILTC